MAGGQQHDHAHPHGHGHGHGHGHRATSSRRLALALGLTLSYMIAEILGGLWTGSLALLADAGHMASDAAALSVSLFALRLARRAATPTRTFGYHRSEVLAALANGAALCAVGGIVAVEAFERLLEPAPVMGLQMLTIACGGLLMNLVAMALLHGGDRDDLNLRGALLHVALDAAGSLGAIVAGLAIWAWGVSWADPVASMLIAALVIFSASALVRDAVAVLMEGTPANIDLHAVRSALESLPGVSDVHDLHVWLITSGMPSASAHVRIGPGADGDALLAEAGRLLGKRFGIDHTTIQIERSEAAAPCGGCGAGA